jgi:prepilin-type N-terminal cleavage/methylation domain-containing protein
MKLSQHNNKKAFSLVELSIVLLIVGLLVAGVTAGKSLLDSAKLSKARSITKSSPVNGIENLVFWVESTSKESFSVATPTKDDPIDLWKNINLQKITKNNVTSAGSARPTYSSDGINGLPALSFDGSDDYLVNEDNWNFSAYTIFVVATTNLDTFSSLQAAAQNGLLTIAESEFNRMFMALGGVGSNAYSTYFNTISFPNRIAYNTTVPINSGTPYIHSMQWTDSNMIGFVNGSQVAIYNSPYSPSDISPNADLRIGQRFGTSFTSTIDGKIGEVIIFDRALGASEMNTIEEYLSAKWGISLN